MCVILLPFLIKSLPRQCSASEPVLSIVCAASVVIDGTKKAMFTTQTAPPFLLIDNMLLELFGPTVSGWAQAQLLAFEAADIQALRDSKFFSVAIEVSETLRAALGDEFPAAFHNFTSTSLQVSPDTVFDFHVSQMFPSLWI